MLAFVSQCNALLTRCYSQQLQVGWLLDVPGVYVYIYTVLYGCVCPWRLALQKEGWRQQMDEIRAVRTVEQLLFALSWSQEWCQKPAPKTGPQYCRKKERLPKLRPRFWDQGVAYTVSPPLRAVSSGNSGTFRLFSWQWAWQSLIQVSQLRAHHQDCIFHMRLRPQKRALVAAPFEHKPTESQMHSPLPNCEETRCNGLCLGRHVARKQARGVEPHMGKLQGDHAIRNYCPSKVGGLHVHAKKVACTRKRLWKVDRMYTRPRSQLHANRKRLCLLVKSTGNRDLWYMWRLYLQPCVEVGGSRLSARPRSQLHAKSRRL